MSLPAAPDQGRNGGDHKGHQSHHHQNGIEIAHTSPGRDIRTAVPSCQYALLPCGREARPGGYAGSGNKAVLLLEPGLISATFLVVVGREGSGGEAIGGRAIGSRGFFLFRRGAATGNLVVQRPNLRECLFLPVAGKARSGDLGRLPSREENRKHRCGRRNSAAGVNLLSPLVQALAPRTVRGLCLSHVRKTLNPGVPVLPFLPASFEAVGQWPVCYAGASQTEDPCCFFPAIV